jgi:subtilase family serine protease
MREIRSRRKGIFRESSAIVSGHSFLLPVLELLIICLVGVSCSSTTSPEPLTENLGQPDLVVASLTHSPANPTTADTMTFVVTVQNLGNAKAGVSVLTLRVGWESNSLSYQVPSLAPNATFQVTYTHQVVYAQNYLNTATADATNIVAESDESNNITTDLFTVTGGAQPNLMMGNLERSRIAPIKAREELKLI